MPIFESPELRQIIQLIVKLSQEGQREHAVKLLSVLIFDPFLVKNRFENIFSRLGKNDTSGVCRLIEDAVQEQRNSKSRR